MSINSIHTPSTRPAGFWLRVAAHLLDNFIVTLALFVLFFVTILVTSPSRVQPLAAQNDVSSGGLYLLLVMLYKAGFEASPLRASPGKHVVGIVVVDRHSRRVSFVRALLRNIFKVFSYLVLGLGFLMAAFPGKKRCLHDILSGSYVVRRGDPSRGKDVGSVE